MKKIIIVVLYAITLTTAFTSCGSKSGNYSKSETEIDTTSVVQLPSSQTVDTVKHEPAGSFTPTQIQITEPAENNKAVIGEGIEGYEYTANILFIDSVGNEYHVELYASVHPIETEKEKDEEWHKNELKELETTKGLFKMFTSFQPTDFYVTYNPSDRKLAVYRKEKATTKKIGNAVVRQYDPGPIWTGYYQKSSHIIPITESITNASNSND